MHKTFALFVAFLATCALAAPAPKKPHRKPVGTFKVPIHRAHPHHKGQKTDDKVDTLHEIGRIYKKFDWSIVLVLPDGTYQTLEIGGGDDSGQSQAPQPVTSTSKAARTSSARATKTKSGSVAAAPTTPLNSQSSSPASSPSSSALAPSSPLYSEAPSSQPAPPASSAIETSSPLPESHPTSSYGPPAASSSSQPLLRPSSSSQAPSWTSSVPSSAGSSASSAAATRKAEGSVSANPSENESEYLSSVSIGGQNFDLDFDTGSADLWVFSSSLHSNQIGSHSAFDPSKSTTWSPAPGSSWKISYGDGSGASGTVGYDVVNIGGATVTKQAVELATQVSKAFVSDVNNDGLVGLAFSSINTVKPQQQKTFFENIMADLDQPVFTADLQTSNAGTYEFGKIDSRKYSGEIHYASIDKSDGFWQFPSSSFTINGKTTQDPNAHPAIADTGTSLVLVDDAALHAYYHEVEGATVSSTAGGYVYPCTSTLPDFGVSIGDSGFVATIPGHDMTFAKVGDGTCYGGVQSNGGGNLQIYGDMLLKQYFAVFDGGNLKFGLAEKSGQK